MKATWCEGKAIGLFFVHLSTTGSYSYAIPIGFHNGARPAKTYNLPAAATPDISSAGSGNGASFTHFVWAYATGVHKIRARTSCTNQPVIELRQRGIFPLLIK